MDVSPAVGMCRAAWPGDRSLRRLPRDVPAVSLSGSAQPLSRLTVGVRWIIRLPPLDPACDVSAQRGSLTPVDTMAPQEEGQEALLGALLQQGQR